MNLTQIAMDAIDEARANSAEGIVSRTDNGDGTVTFSIDISVDPEVRAEKAKAMPKGMKRGDQMDYVQELEGEAEDSSDGVFAFALDSLATACDDAPSRLRPSSLENCRAADPLFCPYHGQQAIEDKVVRELGKRGIPGLSSAKVAAKADVFAAYSDLRAQLDNKDIVDFNSVVDASSDCALKGQRPFAAYRAAKIEADKVKSKFFPNGRLPNGFAKSNYFAEDYAEACNRRFLAQKDLHSANKELNSYLSSVSHGNVQFEVKKARVLVDALRKRSSICDEANKEFADKSVPEFYHGLYLWGKKTNNPATDAAFPDGDPWLKQGV